MRENKCAVTIKALYLLKMGTWMSGKGVFI